MPNASCLGDSIVTLQRECQTDHHQHLVVAAATAGAAELLFVVSGVRLLMQWTVLYASPGLLFCSPMNSHTTIKIETKQWPELINTDIPHLVKAYAVTSTPWLHVWNAFTVHFKLYANHNSV